MHDANKRRTFSVPADIHQLAKQRWHEHCATNPPVTFAEFLESEMRRLWMPIELNSKRA